jgi:hypothetical protein
VTRNCPTAGPLISPLETLNEVPYDKGEYDAEDTVRFCTLRLHESGLIKSKPKTIIPKKPIGVSSTSSNAS